MRDPKGDSKRDAAGEAEMIEDTCGARWHYSVWDFHICCEKKGHRGDHICGLCNKRWKNDKHLRGI
jgi:hypothetical protein